ncbi:MAG: hypothetical protein RMJ35_06775 [Phycisphaerales bacterium]|nr:hypothetical protein [Phycisphaerales bacterium]
MRLLPLFVSLAGFFWLFGGSILAQEASPMYESWAKQKVGASVKLKSSSEMMGQKSELETNLTLVELTPERAIVEAKMTVHVMGQTMEQPAQKLEIPAQVTTEQPTDPIEAMKKMGAEVTELPGEDVTVAGKSYSCKVFQTSVKQGENTVTGKTWTSTEMPGMLVRMESTTEGAMASKTVVEVVEVK